MEGAFVPLERVIRKDFTEKVALEQRSESGEGVSQEEGEGKIGEGRAKAGVCSSCGGPRSCR